MARTGFSLFSAEKRALVAKDHTGETPGALLKILGQQWRALDAAAKLGFEERAAAAAAAVGMFQRPTQKITHEQRMAAVRSRAQVVKGVLSDRDIAALDEMYRCIKAEAYAAADASGSEQLSHPALMCCAWCGSAAKSVGTERLCTAVLRPHFSTNFSVRLERVVCDCANHETMRVHSVPCGFQKSAKQSKSKTLWLNVPRLPVWHAES